MVAVDFDHEADLRSDQIDDEAPADWDLPLESDPEPPASDGFEEPLFRESGLRRMLRARDASNDGG